MRHVGFAASAVISIFTMTASLVAAQCDTEIKFSKDGKQPIAILRLMQSYPTYTSRVYTGKIVHLQYDEATGVNILGFALEGKDGIRRSIDITHDDCVSELSNIERSWLPYLIKKGATVRVDAQLSGSGGYINARNILLVASTVKKK